MSDSHHSSTLELQPTTARSVNSTSNVSHETISNPRDDQTTASRLADTTKPNSGYGWVVVSGCAVITFWFVGTTYSWGVIQASLVQQGLTSASTLSFVGSLTVALNAVLALVSVRFIKLFGARTTGLLGILFLSAGEILSGFSTESVGGLFVTTGVIMGVGVRYPSSC